MALLRSNAFQRDLADSIEDWTQNCDSNWPRGHRVTVFVSVYLLESW